MQRLARLVLLLGLSVAPGVAQPADADGDGLPDSVEQRLGTFPEVAERFVALHDDGPDAGLGSADRAPDFTTIALAGLGGDRWLWRIDFAGEVGFNGAVLILYLDADHDPTTGRQDKPEVIGTDVMYAFRGHGGDESVHNPTVGASRAGRARYALVGNALYICDDITLGGDQTTARCRFRLLSQKPGSGDSMDFVEAAVPRPPAVALPTPVEPGGLDYRGIPGEQVTPAEPPLPFGRPRPTPPFAAGGRVDREATTDLTEVSVEVLEETGRTRHGAPVCFGFPLPQGAVFRPTQIRLVDGGRPLPADIAVTSFWPDGSLRWVSIDAAVELAASQRKLLTVQYGSRAASHPPAALGVSIEATRATVDTGALRAEVGLAPFSLALSGPAGATFTPSLVLRDVAGREYRPGPAELVPEYLGAGKCILRLAAPYVDAAGRPWFRAVLRLTFRAGSGAVELAHTLVDDYLEWEFADFRSLALEVALPGEGPTRARYALGPDGATPAIVEGRELAAPNDAIHRLDGVDREGRSIGVADFARGGAGVAVAVVDFWQRYPKALGVAPDGARIELFPPLDGAANPGELPEHLAFPFVEGCYRFKWGMSATDRVTLVPYGAGAASAALEAALDAAQPVVAVVPAEHYERTRALGDFVAPDADLFRGWDEAFAAAFEQHLRLKEQKREYGFFNWGDWHGERGDNWGNNEYDLPHALFLQFARTGDRRYYRLALAGARHQADVDCIHAYPDPFYLGGNVLHSYAHTGEWSEKIKGRAWSFAYGYHAAAYNGHTWADGLCDSWYLAADPVVMDAALGLGEHIAWQMSRRFDALGTHERSAGWSAHAIAALYRATLDPEYLAALGRIVEVAFREQKFDQGGAWPHPLPEDHAGGVPGAVGNVAFLIGVLCEGIEDYWELTGDERVKRSLEAAAGWLATQWHPEVDVFQYTSSPGFAAQVNRRASALNTLIVGPILRAAEWRGDEEWLELGARAFANAIRYGFDGFGKSFAQVAHFGPSIMARLREQGAAEQPYGADLRKSLVELRNDDLVRAGPSPTLCLRGPTDKVVWFRHGGGEVTFAAERTAWGARPKQEPEGVLQLFGPDGSELARETFSTDAAPWRFERRLTDAPPGIYRLAIHDDLRARWDVTGPRDRVVANDPPAQFGGPSVCRYAFYVPPGARRFAIALTSHHGGAFGLRVCGPGGAVVGAAEGSGTAPARCEITVPAGDDGKVWTVVVYAPTDLSVVVEGLPPYLSTTADGWFDPRG